MEKEKKIWMKRKRRENKSVNQQGKSIEKKRNMNKNEKK